MAKIYNKAKKKEYYLKNRESILKKAKAHALKNKDFKKVYNKKYRKLNQEELKIKDKEKHIRRKEQSKDTRLKKAFGITLNDYKEMFHNQNGLCKICNKPETAKQSNTGGEAVRMLSVDHCHTTGKVRSLLCTNCNILLGQSKDSILILQSAIEYLKYHNEK
jgi:hypothetical protein